MTWKHIVSTIVVFFITSLIAWQWPAFSLLLMIAWAVCAFIVSRQNMAYGVGFMAIDLLVDPMGRLLSYGPISFRMVLFGMLLLVWLMNAFSHRARYAHHLLAYRRLYQSFGIFFATLLFGMFIGFFRGYEFSDILNDANGYAFFLLIPVVLSVNARQIVPFIATGIAWLIAQSAFLFAWFSHVDRPYFDTSMYRFFRDTRVAELTPLTDQGVRIFLQSHIFAALGLVVLVAGRTWILHHLSRAQYTVLLSGCLFLVFMSLSRSMWIGIAAVLVWFMFHRETIIDLLKAGVFSISVLAFLFFLPVGRVGSVTSFIDMFAARGEVASEYAAVSRWIMLPQLNTLIVQQPFLGYGFGFSTDIVGPMQTRMQRMAFEWGWHDVIIKIGALGLAALMWLLYEIMIVVRERFVIASIISLLLIHIFTPYLNHPLGIGWLLGCLMFGVYLRERRETRDI